MFWLKEIVANNAGDIPSYTDIPAFIKFLASNNIILS